MTINTSPSGEPIRITAVSGGMNPNSATRRLIDLITADADKSARNRGLSLAIETIDIRDWAQDVTRMTLGAPPSHGLAQALANVERAHGLIVASPVYKGAYSGLFKSFFDVVDQHALIGTPVVLGGTGGSLRHALMIEASMRPLFAFFQAVTVPTGVFATTSDCASPAGEAPGDDLAVRSAQAAGDLLTLITGSSQGPTD